MTETEFKRLLQANREAAIEAVLNDFVRSCHDDGPEEIARILTVWATNHDRRTYPFLDLGDDQALFAHACHYGTITELEPRPQSAKARRDKPMTKRKP